MKHRHPGLPIDMPSCQTVRSRMVCTTMRFSRHVSNADTMIFNNSKRAFELWYSFDSRSFSSQTFKNCCEHTSKPHCIHQITYSLTECFCTNQFIFKAHMKHRHPGLPIGIPSILYYFYQIISCRKLILKTNYNYKVSSSLAGVLLNFLKHKRTVILIIQQRCRGFEILICLNAHFHKT